MSTDDMLSLHPVHIHTLDWEQRKENEKKTFESILSNQKQCCIFVGMNKLICIYKYSLSIYI